MDILTKIILLVLVVMGLSISRWAQRNNIVDKFFDIIFRFFDTGSKNQRER